jgi:hypothetical protein
MGGPRPVLLALVAGGSPERHSARLLLGDDRSRSLTAPRRHRRRSPSLISIVASPSRRRSLNTASR